VGVIRTIAEQTQSILENCKLHLLLLPTNQQIYNSIIQRYYFWQPNYTIQQSGRPGVVGSSSRSCFSADRTLLLVDEVYRRHGERPQI